MEGWVRQDGRAREKSSLPNVVPGQEEDPGENKHLKGEPPKREET